MMHRVWLLVLLACGASGAWAQSDATSGGGSTTIWGGGEIVFVGDSHELRDFAHYCDWRPGTDILRAEPLAKILTRLEDFHWIHAERLRYTLGKLTFCFTQSPLPAIAPSDPLATPPEPVQTVGLRTPTIVFLNQPLFDKIAPEEQAWLLMHEALHAFIPQNVEMRALKLRSFVHGLRQLLEQPQVDLDRLAYLIDTNEVLWPGGKLGTLSFLENVRREDWNNLFHLSKWPPMGYADARIRLRRVGLEGLPWLLPQETAALRAIREQELRFLVDAVVVGNLARVREAVEKWGVDEFTRFKELQLLEPAMPLHVASWLLSQPGLLLPELAIVRGHNDIVEYLLSRDSWRVALIGRHLDSGLGERNGSRALCLAFMMGNAKAWDALMAIPKIQVNGECMEGSVLSTVAYWGGLPQLEDLLKRPDIDLYERDSQCRTPREAALANRQGPAAALLKKAEKLRPKPKGTPGVRCAPRPEGPLDGLPPRRMH